MITIEEKLELFTKIVFEKIEKENGAKVQEFEQKYGNLAEEKKKQFEKEAERILRNSEREIEREKTRLISRAKVEEKRFLRNTEKAIFDELISALLEFGKEFRKTEEYLAKTVAELKETLTHVETGDIAIHLISEDFARFKEVLSPLLEGKNVQWVQDNEMIGGFILREPSLGIRYDMSIAGKILANREMIGNMLVKRLQ